MIAAYSLIVQIMTLSTGVLTLSTAMLSLSSGITRLSKTLAEAATALPGCSPVGADSTQACEISTGSGAGEMEARGRTAGEGLS